MKINQAQRIVLLVAFIVLLFVVLFPPWVFIYTFPELPQVERPAGYHLLFGQHAPQDRTALSRLFAMEYRYSELNFFNMRIDQTRLTFEIVGVLLLTALFYLLLRSARR
jgi:hypothetical protein